MKKILFTILAAAAVSAACTKFEQDTVPTYDSVAAPEVTATVVSDTEITVTVTAAENTHYYGYAVMKGAPGATADKLVADGYAKDANVVAQGEDNAPQAAQVKYSEETKTVTLELSGLTPLTEYTVYAAAVTEMGVTSEVAVKTVKTTDGTEPVLASADFDETDNVLTFVLGFNDPVQLTGNGTAKAWFYAENYADADDMLILWKEVDIPADHITTSGKNLLIAVPASEYIPGAYVAVTFSEGIVKNGADATNAVYESHTIGYDENNEIQKDGIFGYYDYASWDFSLVDPADLPEEGENDDLGGEEGDEEEVEEVEPVYFSDWTELMMTAYTTSKYPLAGRTGEGGAGVVATESNGKTVSYPAKTFGVVSDYVAAVLLAEAPAYGASISFSIEEGTFMDIFGNVNNAFEAEGAYFCSYGYTLEDIIGSYQYTCASAYSGDPVTGTWTIAESDDPEKGNVMFTEMYSTECVSNVYAQFDPVSGTLTVPSLQLYGANDKYLFAFCSSDNNGKVSDVDVVFAVPEAGVINGQSGYFGDAVINPADYSILGFFDVYYGFEAVRAQAVANAPARVAVRAQF